MIISRYLAAHIHKGAILVLLTLVSLSLFFTFIRELDDVGRGQYGIIQLIQFLLYKFPNTVVEFMPLAALLGAILSLGNLASNSEIIALQSSGLSIKKLVLVVGQSMFVLALIAFLIAEYIVPVSETEANALRSSSLSSNISLQARKGVWIKDDNNIIYIQQLFPNGSAKHIEIYHLNDAGLLYQTTKAKQALIVQQGWQLLDVAQTEITSAKTQVTSIKRQLYRGGLSDSLLASLAVTPQQMSVSDLNSYIKFLQENNLNNKAESLSFWRKIYAPLTIMVMGLLAVPFVLGSQRQSNTGRRLMTGIMLGLAYVVLDPLLIQFGEQLNVIPVINALIPTLMLLGITTWLIYQRMKYQRA